MPCTVADFHYCNQWHLPRGMHSGHDRGRLRRTLIMTAPFRVLVRATGDALDCVACRRQHDRRHAYMVLARIPTTRFGSPLDEATTTGGAWYGGGCGYSLRSLTEIDRPDGYWFDWRYRNTQWGQHPVVLVVRPLGSAHGPPAQRL